MINLNLININRQSFLKYKNFDFKLKKSFETLFFNLVGSYINCGHSLVGQIKGCRFVIQNNGGDGRFVVFPKSAWPASTFKVNSINF